MKETVFNALSEHELEKVHGGFIVTNPFYGIQKWIFERAIDILT